MFKGIKNGWELVIESIKIFIHYPKFLVPLVISWLIYAPTLLYLKYFFNGDAYSSLQLFLIIFGIIFIFAFILSFSCSVLLELIQQFESHQKMRLAKAFVDTLAHNTTRILPIVFVWTIIWFILLIIEALLSKAKNRGKESFNAENAAKTLAGDKEFSLSGAFVRALEKGIRMVVFLILPAIAWENLSFIQAVKKGIAVFRANLVAFATGFMLTEFAGVIILLPLALLFYISDTMKVMFADWVWIAVIIYTAFAWSYSIYLEQMFAAHLYLWHLKWEKEAKRAQEEGRRIPAITDVPKPSLLDKVGGLLDK